MGSGAASVTLKPGANVFQVQGSVASCSASDSMAVYYTPPPPPEKKNAGAPCDCNGSNPICGGTGNKYQREVDYQGSGVFPLRFVRHYNSAWAEERGLGAHWRTHYDRELAAFATQVVITRPEGQAFVFNLSGEVWTAEADVTEHLERLTEAGVFTGWRYTTAEDEVEVYDTQGRLVSIADRAGVSQTLVYDGQGRLSTVTHTPSGRTLRLTYDALHRLSTLTDPGGGVYRYVYDANNNLVSVVYPDATPADPSDAPTRRYHYEDSRFPYHLTGLTDENGNRYATWSYDAADRAVSSEHAGGVDRVTFAYNAEGTTTVTDAFGQARTYTYTNLFGVKKLAEISGDPCPHCGPQARSTTYDANGFVAARTDFNGHVTTYVHDARGVGACPHRGRRHARGTDHHHRMAF